MSDAASHSLPMSMHRSFEVGLGRVRVALTRGFTLLEILVVLAIIGLVAGLAIAHVNGIHRDAQIRTADLFVRVGVKAPLFAYKMALGDFPSTADGLAALATPPAQRAAEWRGPYVESANLRDPWGQPYHYANPGKHNKTGYDLWSNGPDQQDGTADDIGNWEAADGRVAHD
jgi:general secretion pathway protein G